MKKALDFWSTATSDKAEAMSLTLLKITFSVEKKRSKLKMSKCSVLTVDLFDFFLNQNRQDCLKKSATIRLVRDVFSGQINYIFNNKNFFHYFIGLFNVIKISRFSCSSLIRQIFLNSFKLSF